MEAKGAVSFYRERNPGDPETSEEGIETNTV